LRLRAAGETWGREGTVPKPTHEHDGFISVAR
jgi:hypothetical protein